MRESTGDKSESGVQTDEVLIETTPTLRPTLILFTISATIGMLLVGDILATPGDVFGEPQLTKIFVAAISIVTLLVLLKFAIRMVLLLRTRYIISTDSLVREVDLIFHYQSREVPVRQLRGHEFTQNAIQKLLGYGTFRILTAGTNQSLGFLEFTDVPKPQPVRDELESLIT